MLNVAASVQLEVEWKFHCILDSSHVPSLPFAPNADKTAKMDLNEALLWWEFDDNAFILVFSCFLMAFEARLRHPINVARLQILCTKNCCFLLAKSLAT